MNVLAWLAAAVAGWFWVRALLPVRESQPAWLRYGVEAPVALAFGVGAAASVFFALLWAGVKPGTAAWAADAGVLAAGLLLWLLSGGRPAGEQGLKPGAPVPFAWLAATAAAVSLVAFFSATLIYLRANPQGDWDAWSSWNVRARFLVHEGMWRRAVSPDVGESQPGQPLLWPSAVARAWAESGNLEQSAPQSGAFLASAALVALFASAVAAAGWQWMCLGICCLLSMVPLWRAAPGQYPDVPLALYVLAATLTAMSAGRARWSPRALALSGALASFAAFTRTEGAVFAALLAVTLAVVARVRVLWWLAGAAPGLLLASMFHVLLAPSAPGNGWALLQDAGRFASAAGALASALWKLGEFPAHPLLFLAALYFAFRPARRMAPVWPLIPAGLMLVADFVWIWGARAGSQGQLAGPPDRLLLHAAPALLVPVILWLSGSAAGQTPGEAVGPAEPRRQI